MGNGRNAAVDPADLEIDGIRASVGIAEIMAAAVEIFFMITFKKYRYRSSLILKKTIFSKLFAAFSITISGDDVEKWKNDAIVVRRSGFIKNNIPLLAWWIPEAADVEFDYSKREQKKTLFLMRCSQYRLIKNKKIAPRRTGTWSSGGTLVGAISGEI